MEKSKGYDNTIGYAIVVSVSASCSRCYNLALFLRFPHVICLMYCVVATTRRNGTRSLLTSAKLSVGYLVVGITRELDKEPLLYCSSIYINYM